MVEMTAHQLVGGQVLQRWPVGWDACVVRKVRCFCKISILLSCCFVAILFSHGLSKRRQRPRLTK